ncbi:MAG: esterase/lipase family protein [Legionellales bacterium]
MGLGSAHWGYWAKAQHLVAVLALLCAIGAVQAQTPVTPSRVSAHLEHKSQIIVLIHGLMRTSLSMYFLKSYLKAQGYQVYSYSYPSAKYSIQEHGIHLNHFITDLQAKNKGLRIHFITHSLGGIISREAISKLDAHQRQSIGCLIMLAPPNQGSLLAKYSTKIIPIITNVIKPLKELSSDNASYVHRVPVPKIKMGIIVGRYDAKVPPASGRLNAQTELRIVNSTHTFIMNNAETKRLITNFLEKGTFKS